MPRLYVDELVSVGMVAAGDNPEASVVIYKARPPAASNMKKSAESATTTREVNMDLSAIEDQELRKSIEDRFAELESQVSELPASVGEVVKAESDAVQEFIAKQQEELDVLRKDLDAERTARRASEYVAKAAPFEALLGKPDEVGPVLADIADKAPESYEKLESALLAASQREDMAKLFSVMGAGEGEGDADPIAKRDSWVAANKRDSETDAQARARFWVEHPDMTKASRS